MCLYNFIRGLRVKSYLQKNKFINNKYLFKKNYNSERKINKNVLILFLTKRALQYELKLLL